MSIESIEDTVSEFLPEKFFAGQLEGWAVFESLSGLQERASIRVIGTVNDETGS